jgi:hypothetical protein
MLPAPMSAIFFRLAHGAVYHRPRRKEPDRQRRVAQLGSSPHGGPAIRSGAAPHRRSHGARPPSAPNTRARSATTTRPRTAALPRHHRPHQRLRPRARHLPLKGQVLEPPRGVVVRRDARHRAQPRDRCPTPTSLVATECEPLPVEMVMRSYVTGVTSTSIWTHYARGGPHLLRQSVARRAAQERPAARSHPHAEHQGRNGGHDVSVSRDELLGDGRSPRADFDAAGAEIARALFARGQRTARSAGSSSSTPSTSSARHPTAASW